ncbi:3',5'-cyclic-nucleotide phosphodiesterase regA [Leucoagaricus sp. SymC.cos]|nr:3',5'-cyclic-nucleotide phosphodiesterase regA [Leucoagaricus sp. SymC.cos]
MVVSEAVLRRRSADVGGLHLAMHGESQGQGWLDSTGSDTNIATDYAELCATMYKETLRLVENNVTQNDPPALSQEDRERLLKGLESWYFEPLRMQEDELLACVLFLFQVLFRIEGMRDTINVEMDVIRRFIIHIRQLYRWQNHYHNFEHAVDVLQAVHCYLRVAGMVPPVTLLMEEGMWSSTREHDSGPLVTCLTPREIFGLYLAAIGHDVGHPGLNNPFMKNAEAPLSRVYDNQSALEQMHNYLLLMAMRHYGLGVLLDDSMNGIPFRKLLTNSVLATDMGVHQAFMEQFEQILDGTTESSNGIVKWQAPKCIRQSFICQLLLKNADISNPCRPFSVSKQWASALQQEWACQYKFENFLQLKHSVNPSNEPLAEANSQVFFTKNIAKPLVDMTTIAIPELTQYSYHCAENLREWERILKELKEAPAVDNPPSAVAPSIMDSTNPSSASSSVSPTRQNSIPHPSLTTLSTTSLNNHASDHHHRSPPHSHASPVPLSMNTSVSTLSSTSSTSSSNPVSPRITEDDYSTAFRLALPRAKPDGSSLSPAVTPGSVPGSIIGSALSITGRSNVSRTPSSGGIGPGVGGAMSPGGTGGVLSPSLSRAAACVVSGGSGSPSSSSPSPHINSRHTLNGPNIEDRTQIDGYRFPPTSPTSASIPSAPPPTADPSTSMSYIYQHVRSQPTSQTHSSAPSVSPSDSPSQIQERDDCDGAVVEDQAAEAGDEYEHNFQTHRVNFHHAVGQGLGMNSLKKRRSTNVLRSSPFGYSPSPYTNPASSVVGGSSSPPLSSVSTTVGGLGNVPGPRGSAVCGLPSHNPNRASWCAGEPFSLTPDHEISTMAEAIESWRGRWGSASFGVSVPAIAWADGETGTGKTGDGSGADGKADGKNTTLDVNGLNGFNEGGPGSDDAGEAQTVPAGLVSPAPLFTSGNVNKIDPQTPLRQAGPLNHETRPGSPTPKMLKKASMELLNANGGGASGKKTPRSRSRSKPRAKGRGKK